MSRLLLGALLVFLSAIARPVSAQIEPGDVVVNEILYAPSPSQNEFVEVYNRSDHPVRLDHLALADANRSFSPVTDTDTTLASGAYAVLVRDPQAFRAAFGDIDGFVIDEWQALNNGGDTVYLRDDETGTLVDSVPYDPSWGGDDGRSLERIDPDGPSNSSFNFAASEADVGATPGSQNSVYAPDDTPPRVEKATPNREGDSLFVVMSEPLAPASVAAEGFTLDGPDAPTVAWTNVSADDPTRVRCALATPLSTGEYTLVVSGISDRRGNVLTDGQASFSFFVSDMPAPGDVVVNEILYAPSGASSEFIELYNRSDKLIDLGALQYADEKGAYDPAAEPLTALRPGHYAVLVADREAFSNQFPSVEAVAPVGWDALNNGGDAIVLRHAPSATVIDSVPYRPAWGGAGGASLERVDPRGSSLLGSNFASSTAANGATPGARNSEYSPDTAAPTPVFAEMVGERSAEVTFTEPVVRASVTSDAFTLSEAHVTSTSLTTDRVVRLTLSGTPTTTTLGVHSIRDYVGNTLDQTSLPLGFQPTEGAIVINEIMYAPRADDFDDRPNQVEYVELYNISDRPLTVNGLFMTDRPTENGVADTVQVGGRRTVAAQSFAVIAAAPAGSTRVDGSTLAAAFPDAPLVPDSVTYLPVEASRLGLQNSGDLIRVHRADGRPVAGVNYTPDWHAPALADPKGTALARISATGQDNAARNWTSSTHPSGGTPGTRNAVSVAPPDDAPAAPGLHVEPSPFSIERDGGTRIQYTLENVPNLVRARIYDARGRKVRTIEEARLADRSGEIVWNGRDDAGNRVRIGIYVILFEAVRADAGDVTTMKKTVVFARPLN